MQRPDDACQLGGGAGGVEHAVGRPDLLGIGDALLCLIDKGRALVEGLYQQVAPQLLQALCHGAVGVLVRDRLDTGEADRSAVQTRGETHDADAGLLVAGHDRSLDRRRAAPAGQQRRMHVEDLPQGEQRVGDERSEGADDRGGLAAASGTDDQVYDVGVVDLRWLGQLQAELSGGVGHGG